MKKRNFLQRVIITVVVTLLGLYMVFLPHGRRPHLSDFKLAGIKNTLRDNIKLGLDLKGGSHLVMRVKTDEYLKKLTENDVVAAQLAAKDQGLETKDAHAETTGGNYRVVLTAAEPLKANEIKEAVEKKVELNAAAGWSYYESGGTLSWTLTGAAQRTMADQATEQALKIIESRINAIGVTEPTLQRHGGQNSHQILLQMPGIQDPERVKALVAGQSHLELVHVLGPPSPNPVQSFTTEQEAIASIGSGGTVPPNRRVLPYAERDEPTAGGQGADPNAQKTKRWVVVESPAIVDGSELRTASASQSKGGGSEYEIDFSLKKSGEAKFGPWTGAHINDFMGVVLNDEVKCVCVCWGL